jgi:hypothetical protein
MLIKPIRPNYQVQILHEITARYYLILLIVLLALWGEKTWYYAVSTILLLVFEPLRIFCGFKGNLSVSVQWSLAAIAFAVFPVLPLIVALLVGESGAGRTAVLALHVVLVVFSAIIGCVGVAGILTNYRARALV